MSNSPEDYLLNNDDFLDSWIENWGFPLNCAPEASGIDITETDIENARAKLDIEMRAFFIKQRRLGLT